MIKKGRPPLPPPTSSLPVVGSSMPGSSLPGSSMSGSSMIYPNMTCWPMVGSTMPGSYSCAEPPMLHSHGKVDSMAILQISKVLSKPVYFK